MNKKDNLMKSLDDVARLAGGYVKQSLPVDNPERDRLISEALSKRKTARIEKV
ncbi:hypothetical protein H8B09_22465 [Paenibacillus sp. PR3]|uniref:Uncharacterized protein n=1 Tax=Paenibacillus terricola TaxID=2763503 RepID=A0ABR8N026_9BACL|nr:hypothetical protein [Paenibacillus terricola]MBD3921549.1 hypothetical protein [Paenibacillus terricola]